MYTFVKFDYLAANSLVELKEKKSINHVSFDDIIEYGSLVKENLRKQNIEAILLFSEENIEEFEESYSELFEIKDNLIQIKSKIKPEDIRRRILRYVPANVFLAMLEDNSLSAIKSLTK